MEELNRAFNEYINEFKNLTTKEKRNEVLNSIKEMIVIFEKLAEIDNIKLEYLKTNEILEYQKSENEDEFLEAELIYIENAKNLIGQYLDKKVQ